MTLLPASAAFHAQSSYSPLRPPSIPPVAPPVTSEPAGWRLPPGHLPAQSLAGALTGRRSSRAFTGAPLTPELLGEVLRLSLGASAPGRRTYPSAGGFHANRAYVVPLRVTDLPGGAFRYQAQHHALLEVAPDGSGVAGALHFAHERDLARAAAVVFITTDLGVMGHKYGERAYRFALQESGHMAQNLLLCAAAAGLPAVPLGNFLDDVSAQVLRLPDTEHVLYAVALGGPGPDDLGQLSQVDAPLGTWLQWRLYAPDPAAALRDVFASTLPDLLNADLIRDPWIMFKGDGGLHARLRLRLPDPQRTAEVTARLEAALDTARQRGTLTQAVRTPYEPEAGLLGGAAATALAHGLFALDSRVALALGERGAGARQGASHVWTELLLRDLGLDAFERWDVWRRVRALRGGAHPSWEAAFARTRPLLEALLSRSDAALEAQFLAGLPGAHGDLSGARQAARAIADLNRTGDLTRGPRELAAILIIFHWNRLMFGPAEQAFLAYARHELSQPQ
ncbi:thiopeptide-type bacteriocin biosynthesis protein [Deinococcus sp. ME38]|uniref:thiopeptide-type bacteriocin biosynthesis protein n=1 Tax=Deinococcus sp. ME38 TaxID=3400344 RepID=UPI003B5CA42D